jgi:hypothetical protein
MPRKLANMSFGWSLKMNSQAVVNALLQAMAPGTSNSHESQPSPNKQTSLVIEQVLRHFPGHYVLSAQDGAVEFHVFMPASVVHKPNETDILWMSNYYSAHPPVCEDDSGSPRKPLNGPLLRATGDLDDDGHAVPKITENKS